MNSDTPKNSGGPLKKVQVLIQTSVFVCRGGMSRRCSQTFLSPDVTKRLRGYLLSEVEVCQVWGGGGEGLGKFVCVYVKEEREGEVESVCVLRPYLLCPTCEALVQV